MLRRGTLSLAMALASCAPAEDPLVVFAAASLTEAAHEIVPASPDHAVRIVTGATSLLARQIERGAPADVFLSAHPVWIRQLDAAGRLRSPVAPLGTGELVIVTGRGARPGPPAPTPAQALAGAERIAIADPAHVPAGVYAREALGEAWEEVELRVVPTADVRAALVAVDQGAADAAVVYASDVAAPGGLRVVYRFGSGPGIRYEGVVVGEHPGAADWLEQLASPEASAQWRALGFGPPAP